MRKIKTTAKAIIIVFVILFLVFTLIFCSRTTFWHLDSPDKNYQLFGWLTDKGGFGYSGNYYIKENSIFAQWHYIGSGPSDCQWLSETAFSFYTPNGTQYYSIFDFIQ